MRPAVRNMLELGGYQVAWLACAWAAAAGSSALSLLATGTFLLLQVIANRANLSWLSLMASGCAGAAVESLFAATGVVSYSASWPSAAAAPAWIIGLWLAFGSTFTTMAAAFGAHPAAKAALLGALFAPLAYAGGEGLGALQIGAPRGESLAIIAAAWAVALPILISVHLRDLRRRGLHRDTP